MGDSVQGRFGPPPVEVVAVQAVRARGRWRLTVTHRREGTSDWQRFDLAELDSADAIEAVVTEVYRLLG